MISIFGRGLSVLACLSIVSYAVIHQISGHSMDDHNDNVEHGATEWLRMHPPRQAAHDAELLRRRLLAQLVELPGEELAEHVPAIMASLDHDDDHVRNLAVDMLSRLTNVSVGTHAARLAEFVSSDDGRVRQGVVRALGLLPPLKLQKYSEPLVDMLADTEPSVRWAAVDTLTLLPPDALAAVTLTAIDRLVQQQDLSIAKAAVSAWANKLEAGTNAYGAVMDALSRLGVQADTRASGTGGDFTMGLRYNDGVGG